MPATRVWTTAQCLETAASVLSARAECVATWRGGGLVVVVVVLGLPKSRSRKRSMIFLNVDLSVTSVQNCRGRRWRSRSRFWPCVWAPAAPPAVRFANVSGRIVGRWASDRTGFLIWGAVCIFFWVKRRRNRIWVGPRGRDRGA